MRYLLIIIVLCFLYSSVGKKPVVWSFQLLKYMYNVVISEQTAAQQW